MLASYHRLSVASAALSSAFVLSPVPGIVTKRIVNRLKLIKGSSLICIRKEVKRAINTDHQSNAPLARTRSATDAYPALIT